LAKAEIEVAAAVLWRREADKPDEARDGIAGQQRARQFLLTQRPHDKVYAGYWEFPGGKIEAAESPAQALQRELAEELAIMVRTEDLRPWISRRYSYPHAEVCIHFLQAHDWSGTLSLREHTACTWCLAGNSPHVAPLLPANASVFRGLCLPTSMWISNATDNGVVAETKRASQALSTLRSRHMLPPLVQLRDKTLPLAERADLGLQLKSMLQDVSRESNTPETPTLVVNASNAEGEEAELARQIKADGLHLTGSALVEIQQRPHFSWVGASVHDAAQLRRASLLNLDYAVLGSVLPTSSHPMEAGLGWSRFGELIKGCPLPVYAIGGMTRQMQVEATRHGAHGTAHMRRWAD